MARNWSQALATFLTALLVVPASLLAQSRFPSDGEIRRLLEERRARGGIVGVVVGLLEADGSQRVVSAGTAGNSVPLDEDTVFEIGSITKPFTAILLAELADRGELRLEDPVAKYLPAGQRAPARNGKGITLLDLATHTAGLPREATNLRPSNPKNPYVDFGVADMYAFLAGYELPRDPGESWDYSNIGFALLGHLLERRAEMPFEQLLRARLLDPLRLHDTAITLPERLSLRAAQGFDERLEPTPALDRGALPAAGGLRSTVRDLLRFAAANVLAGGDDRLGRAMRATHQPRRPRKDEDRIGLAWTVERPAQRTITWHWGATGGCRSYLGLDLEAKRAVVILANSTAMLNDLGNHLLDPAIPLALPDAPRQPEAGR